jgi:flagellar motor switch protein FliM
MNATPYDFRKPSRLATDLEQQLVAWLTRGCSLVPEKWAKHLAAPIEHAVTRIETARPGDTLAELSDEIVACVVTIGPEPVNTLMVWPRPLVLTLVAGMLGDVCTELSADRSLTPVEDSLDEYLVQQMLKAIQESWPEDEPLAVQFKNREPAPKRTRIFAPDDNIVRFSFSMGGPFGEQAWQWLLPQKGLMNLLSRNATGRGAAQDQGARARLESLVGEMPLEVSVRLGSAVLHVADIVGMQAGDVVLLDQPVSRPLTAAVAGETRFRVWPGRVGAKQAVQIESLVEC